MLQGGLRVADLVVVWHDRTCAPLEVTVRRIRAGELTVFRTTRCLSTQPADGSEDLPKLRAAAARSELLSAAHDGTHGFWVSIPPGRAWND